MGVIRRNLRSCQFANKGKIVFNQPFIYLHQFPSTQIPVFYLTVFNSIDRIIRKYNNVMGKGIS